MADNHVNFGISTVATAPSPATSGTSLVVAAGTGADFPTAPFNATVWPVGTQPTKTNAEIVRVTAKSTDTFTITRAQEGTSVRTIVVGDQISATITAKTLTDVETDAASRASIAGDIGGTAATPLVKSRAVTYTVGPSGSTADYVCDGTNDNVEIQQALTDLNTAGGGTLHIRKGTYQIQTGMTLYPNITIRGEGRGVTILQGKSPGYGNGAIFHVGNGEAGYSSGSANPADTYVGISISDLEVDLNGLSISAADFYGAGNIVVRNMYVHGGSNYGFYFANCNKVWVENNDIRHLSGTGTQAGIQFKGVWYGWVVNNYVYDNYGSPNTQGLDSHATDGTYARNGQFNHILNNYIDTCSQGINNEDSNTVISGNTILNTQGLNQYAIGLRTAPYNTIVSNNMIDGSASGVTVTGISLFNTNSSARSIIITGNTIRNINGTNTSDGMFLANATNVTVTNNVVCNSGRYGVYNRCANVVWGNNKFYDDQGTATQTQGLFNDTGASIVGIDVAQDPSDSSGGVTIIKPRDAVVGLTNKAGGELRLQTGISTGNASSFMSFYTSTAGSSGTTTQPLQEKMRLFSSSNGRLVIGTTFTSTVDGILMVGNVARSLLVGRHTTGNVVGNSLTIQAGGTSATNTATDKSGGALILAGGIATGTGSSQINFQTATPQASTSTSDNTPDTKMTLTGNGRLYIGGSTTPTAILHLAAGTATASTAPLKLTTGTALTTPEDGALEYDTSHLWFTIGSTRYQIDQQSSGGGAPTTSQYVTLATDATLTNERVLTGTSNQITITDNGAGSTIVLSTPQNIHTGATPTFAGMSLGSGNLSTVGNISMENSAARDITVAQASGTTGRNLTIQAGQSVTGGTNEIGGQLLLKGGAGTGSDGNGVVAFYTATSLGSGTTTQTLSEKGRFTGATNGVLLVGITAAGGGIATNDGINLGGTVARSIHLTNNTGNNAGNNLGIKAGSAAPASATDKAGGTLILASGISTGTGASKAIIQTATTATATGTAANTLVDRIVVTSPKALTDGSATNLVSCTIASGSAIGGLIRYTIEATDGTDYQSESGYVVYNAVNKAGTVTRTITEHDSQQALSGGTLATTWAISAASPAVISVNADTSLTASTGYPRITYTVENYSQQAIAIQ